MYIPTNPIKDDPFSSRPRRTTSDYFPLSSYCDALNWFRLLSVLPPSRISQSSSGGHRKLLRKLVCSSMIAGRRIITFEAKLSRSPWWDDTAPDCRIWHIDEPVRPEWPCSIFVWIWCYVVGENCECFSIASDQDHSKKHKKKTSPANEMSLLLWE